MKALTYTNAHTLSDFSLQLNEVPRPTLRVNDVLVAVRATAINPVDYKIRQSRSGTAENPVILGWDAAGVIIEVGPEVRGFSVGDEVYYAGDLTRAGSYAELQAVDSRIISKKPSSLSFAEAAALPLTSLTAWEALIESRIALDQKETNVLIIGGAGGVGSMAIQILKALTPARVIATASREESKNWAKKLGADVVIDYRNLKEELAAHNVRGIDLLFATTQSQDYWKDIPDLMNPFGHVVAIDDPGVADVRQFKSKSLRFHWELMFTKTLFQHNLESQGEILAAVSKLVDSGKIRTTAQTVLKGLNPKNLEQAHSLIQSGKSIGKVVIEI